MISELKSISLSPILSFANVSCLVIVNDENQQSSLSCDEEYNTVNLNHSNRAHPEVFLFDEVFKLKRNQITELEQNNQFNEKISQIVKQSAQGKDKLIFITENVSEEKSIANNEIFSCFLQNLFIIANNFLEIRVSSVKIQNNQLIHLFEGSLHKLNQKVSKEIQKEQSFETVFSDRASSSHPQVSEITTWIIQFTFIIDSNQQGKLIINSAQPQEIQSVLNILTSNNKQERQQNENDILLKTIENLWNKDKQQELEIMFVSNQSTSEVKQSSIDFFRSSRDIQSQLEHFLLKQNTSQYNKKNQIESTYNSQIQESSQDIKQDISHPIKQSCLSQESLDACRSKLSEVEYQKIVEESSSQKNELLEFQTQFLQNEIESITQKYQELAHKVFTQESFLQQEKNNSEIQKLNSEIFQRDIELSKKDSEIMRLNDELGKCQEQIQFFQQEYHKMKQQSAKRKSYRLLSNMYNEEEEQIQQNQENEDVITDKSYNNQTYSDSYCSESSIDLHQEQAEPAMKQSFYNYNNINPQTKQQSKPPSLRYISSNNTSFRNQRNQMQRSNDRLNQQSNKVKINSLIIECNPELYGDTINDVAYVQGLHSSKMSTKPLKLLLETQQNELKKSQQLYKPYEAIDKVKEFYQQPSFKSKSIEELNSMDENPKQKLFIPLLSNNKIQPRVLLHSEFSKSIESIDNSTYNNNEQSGNLSNKNNNNMSILNKILSQQGKFETPKAKGFNSHAPNTLQKNSNVLSSFKQELNNQNQQQFQGGKQNTQVRLNTVETEETTQTMLTTAPSTTNSAYPIKNKFQQDFIRSAVPSFSSFLGNFSFKSKKQ